MKLTTNDVAKRVNLTRQRIIQLINRGLIEAEKFGRDWVIDESQIAVIRRLPDNRGKYERKKSIIKINSRGEIAA